VDTFMRVRPDLVLLDLRLPDGTGFDVLTRLAGEEAVIIMITGHADVPLAVQAMQAGAEHFLQKPVDPAHLEAAVDRALEKARLRQLAQLARERRGGGRVSALLGTSPAMRELRTRSSCSRPPTGPRCCWLGKRARARAGWRR